MTQSCHAAIQFQKEHPDIQEEWFVKSNYLAILAVEDEEALTRLIEEATRVGIRLSVFREPDIDNAITAIALEPGNRSKRLCSRFPLALKAA